MVTVQNIFMIISGSVLLVILKMRQESSKLSHGLIERDEKYNLAPQRNAGHVFQLLSGLSTVGYK